MNEEKKMRAENLFVKRYGQTPAEKGLHVIEYSEELGSFVYAKSEKVMKAYKKYHKLCKLLFPYFGLIMVSALALFVWTSFTEAPAELIHKVNICWDVCGIAVSLIYLLALACVGWPIKKDSVILVHDDGK